MRIWIDPQKLIGFNLTPADVNAAIAAQNAQVSAGSIGDLPGTNPEMAQVDVQNRLKVIESRLPQAVNQQGLQVEKVSAGFLLLITLTSTDGKLDDVALSDYLARNVMNEIKRLDGVGKAQLYGAERAMRIWIDPQKLLSLIHISEPTRPY